MGNSQNKQNSKLPEKAYRIMSIQQISLAQRNDLSIMTDYILSNPKQLNKQQGTTDLTVFSILDRTCRKVTVQLGSQGKLGLKIRQQPINECILKITKVFKGSPIEKHRIETNQYIVGILQGPYSNINQFASLIKDLCNHNLQILSFGICNKQGKTRLVQIPLKQLRQWSKRGRGILGCELAEGWANRWIKPHSQSQINSSSQIKQQTVQTKSEKVNQIPQIPVQIMRSQNIMTEKDKSFSSCSSDEVQEKCNGVLFEKANYINENNITEIKYKGILKNNLQDDASSICKCKPFNRFCQICFMEKNNTYYFFNKKTNQIIGFPKSMMFRSSQHFI